MGEQKKDQTGPGTALIMGASVLGAGATIFLSWLAWKLLDRPYDELSGWIEAGATVAAVGAAIVAGFYAARAYGLEHTRERRWEDAQRSAQAALVVAWPGGHGAANFGGTPVITSVNATVRNAAQLPATDVKIAFYAVRDNDYESAQLVYTHPAFDIPPDTQHPLWVNLSDVEHQRTENVPGTRILVEMTFRDSATVLWRRTLRSQLKVVD